MDETSVQRHIEAMMDAEIIGVDTESTGLGVKDGRNYLTGISVAYRLGPLGIMSAYFPFRHPEGNLDRNVVNLLSTVFDRVPVVFHNSKFDLHNLATLGIHPKSKIFCTENIANMVNEEWPSKKLQWLSKTLLKDSKDRDKVKEWTDAFGWDSVPAELMAPYACKDAELALRLFEELWPRMKEQELATLWPTERRFTSILVNMERQGVGVNTTFCEEKAFKGRDRLATIADTLDIDKLGSNALERLLLDELGLPVIKRGKPTKAHPEGRPSFDKKVMEEYDELLASPRYGGNETAQLILEYRGWQKAVTSLYEPMLRLISPDGRVRPNFRQAGTRTGRLSCAEPNLQQVPRKTDKPWNGDAKRAFLASDGFGLYGFDYAQLEFRLAAVYGNEAWLLEEFSNPDGDVFTAMADRSGVARQTIKTFTYATLYGAGLPRIAFTLGQTEEQVKPLYESFKDTIPGILRAGRVASQRAKERGFVRYWTGRRRHFPYREGYHKAFNSLLQGGGAELVKRAMITLDDNVCDDNCRMVLQVHDEIVFEIKDGMYDSYAPRIIKHMVNFPEFPVTFSVDGKVWNA